jgi:ERAP1-like C-terminal domain
LPAQQRFQSFLKDPATLNPDLRPSVLGVVGRFADQKTYDALHALGRKAETTEEKELYYGAMAAARDPKLAQQTLALSLTDELPISRAPYVILDVAEAHPSLAWDFTKRNVTSLDRNLAEFSKYKYFGSFANVFTDDKQAADLEAFAQAKLSPQARPDIAKAAERIRSRAALKQRELSNIGTWLCNEAPQISGSQVQICVTGEN